jgi:D-cysteine desulfhydrase
VTSSAPPRRSAPALAEHLSRPPACIAFADLPTPIERASWLDAGGAEVWIKRDDLSCELYGGGKVRKLEWALANPPYDEDAPIFSTGGIGSNHLVALAIFLHRLDRKLHALVFDQSFTDHVRDNLATVASLGSEFWYVRGRWQLPLMWARHALGGGRGRAMTPGASTPLACFGFVEAGLELAAQIEAGVMPRPTAIFITGGTGGAAAGLAIGLALAKVATHLHIVSAVEPTLFNRLFLGAKLRAVFKALRAHGLAAGRSVRTFLADAGVTWSIDHDFVGAAYGAPTEAGDHVRRLAEAHGIHLDPTYTAKCVAGMRAAGRRGPVLFWHTHAATDLSRYIVDDWRDRLPPKLRARLDALRPAATPAAVEATAR